MPIAELARIVLAELVLDERAELLRFGRPGLPLDAGVDVFGVLAEDDDVELLRLLHRAADALEVAHRANARVEVEHLAQRDVQRANAAADGRRERPLDRDAELLHRVDRLLRQPVLVVGERLFAGEDFHPRDAPLAAVGLLDRRVEHAHRRAPDVGRRFRRLRRTE